MNRANKNNVANIISSVNTPSKISVKKITYAVMSIFAAAIVGLSLHPTEANAQSPTQTSAKSEKIEKNTKVAKKEAKADIKPNTWEPSQIIYSYAPTGVGGGIDTMGRLIQDIIIKYGFIKYPLVMQNRSAQSGSGAFLEMKEFKNDPHRLLFTLTNLFSNPYSQNIPFRWSDLEPITVMAFDQFILWVPAGTQTDVKTFIEEARKANGKMIIGGTGEKQEDQIVSEAVGKSIGAKFVYTTFPSGGEVAKQLAAKKIAWSVNNPNEAINEWKAGQVLPLCVFDSQRMPYKKLITKTKSWNDIPTCKEQGIDVVYLMHRGVFAAAGITEGQKQFYRNLMKQVSATPEWQTAAEDAAWNLTQYTGAELKQYFVETDKLHFTLMKDAGFLYKEKKAEPKVEAKVEKKAEPKMESKVEAKVEKKADAKLDAKK